MVGRTRAVLLTVVLVVVAAGATTSPEARAQVGGPEMVSVDSNEAPYPTPVNYTPSISSDGGTLAFGSAPFFGLTASGLEALQSLTPNDVVRNRAAGTTTGWTANGNPVISGNGCTGADWTFIGSTAGTPTYQLQVRSLCPSV